MEIKAVIFDMDGVIFDTERIYFEVWHNIFKKYGYELSKEIYVSVMGTGKKNVIETFVKEYGENLPIEQMYHEKDKAINKYICENKVPLKRGALELLKYIKGKGIKLALATSASSERVSQHLSHSKLDGVFNEIISREDIVNLKPNPEIFLKAAEKLNVHEKNCIVIEDSFAGVKAAFKANMTVINVPDLKEADKDIINNSHRVLSDLFEVKKFIESI